MKEKKPGAYLQYLRAGRGLVTVFLCLSLVLAGCRGGRGSAGPGAENPPSSSGQAGQADPASTASASESGDTDLEEVPGDAPGESAAETGSGYNAAGGSTAASSAAASGDSNTAAPAGPDASASSTQGSASPAPAVSTDMNRDEPEGFTAEGKDLVIVLDPGHSSTVPGTEEPIGPGSTEMKEADTEGTYGPASALHEYELTMRVSQKLRSELEERGYTVRLTHLDTVNPISCAERAQVANDNAADAFIRIHANSDDDPDVNGARTICITEDNPYHPELYSASSRLSEILLDTYCEQTGARREKVWETDTMTGNNWSEVPASMIELGYMSNPDEDLNMAMDSYQKKMVNAIADGLDKWFEEMPPEEFSMHPTLNGQARPGSEEDQDLSVSPDEPVPAGTTPASVPASTDDGTGTDGSGSTDSAQQETSEDGVPITVGGEAADSDDTDTGLTVGEDGTASDSSDPSGQTGKDDGTENTDTADSQTGGDTDREGESESSEEEDLQEPQPGGVPFR